MSSISIVGPALGSRLAALDHDCRRVNQPRNAGDTSTSAGTAMQAAPAVPIE
jgi:hypothetical protein